MKGFRRKKKVLKEGWSLSSIFSSGVLTSYALKQLCTCSVVMGGAALLPTISEYLLCVLFIQVLFFADFSQTATSSVSSSLQQCIEEKIHSVTSELVDQLLTLPNVVWVELSGHLGVTINNCFSFTVLPKPSGLLKRNKNKLCADVPGKNQCTVSDLGEDSAEREATEYVHVSATGFGKDSIENEATKCVPETGWGNDSAEREATEHVHVSVTGFGKDSIENAGTKCAPETGWGNDSAEKEATEHVAETSLSKNFIKSKATEHASETDLDKDATESEATEQVLETALDRDAAEDSSGGCLPLPSFCYVISIMSPLTKGHPSWTDHQD